MLRILLPISFMVCSFLLYAQIDHWETVVYDTTTWKYKVPDASTSANWFQPGFADATWTSGQGGMGFGDGDDGTVIPSTSVSVYMRKTFQINSLANIASFVLNMDYDDGFVVYLNGVEIARNGLTGTPPAYNQLASISHEAALYLGGYPDQFEFQVGTPNFVLQQGVNVLAVEVHNQTQNSSDLTARPFLHIASTVATTVYYPTPAWFNPPFVFSTSNLPIVKINTFNVQIPDEPKIDAVMGIIWNGDGQVNNVSDSCTEFYGEIGIERRGSSSNGFPQASYGLETRGPDPALNYNVSLFDWPAENDWILYAPYTDKALIRNVLTYKLGNDMGNWSPRTKLCEVILNGEYQGVYVLMERIKQSPGRVNINKLELQDTLNNELTGGYILKVDKTTAGGVIAWNSPYTSQAPSNTVIGFQLHDPELAVLHPTQLTYIQNHITEWETVLKSNYFNDPDSGYVNYIDVESFIDYILVNELSKNVDGYRLSAYLYKERLSEGGKIVAGPLWDFNLAFGNANYCQGGQTTGWELDFNAICPGGWNNPFWYKRLLEDSVFANQLNCRYQTLRQTDWQDSVLVNYIDSMALMLSDPADRHYSRWPILGTYVWPNNFIGISYQQEIDYMKNWILDRLQWLDANIFGACPNLQVSEWSEDEDVHFFPNPTSDLVTVSLANNGNSLEELTLFNMSGQVVLSEVCKGKKTSISLQHIPSGFYFLSIRTKNGKHFTSKLIKQ